MAHLLNRKNVIILFIVLALLVTGYFLLLNPKAIWRKDKVNAGNDQSIAVLPFENMSNDTTQDYFSDGLAEGVRNSLAHVNGLKVCASSSSFQFRGKDVDIKE